MKVHESINFKGEVATIEPRLIALRRELHQVPEMGNDLPLTQALVLQALNGLPLEVHTGRLLTSVVAVLRGRGQVPNDTRRPTILLRGDMDGLPLTEETGLPFASTNGFMHACGHDLHTAGLIGAAILLSAHLDDIPGDVVFMFQPGEEGPGGAEPMIAEGVLEVTGQRPDAVYGLHVVAHKTAGEFSIRPKTIMAGVGELEITVTGRGGHGAEPHKSMDPVPVACEIVLALQSYLSRRVNVFDPIVITVGEIHAGSAVNIIPDSATLKGSVRVLSDAAFDQLARDLPLLSDGIAQAHGCLAETRVEKFYPPTVNDPDETAFVVEELTAMYGPDRVKILEHPWMASEDFSLLLQQVPGAFILLGANPGQLAKEPLTNHSPEVVFDDVVLADAAVILAQLAYDRVVSYIRPTAGVKTL
nr:M20 family metallopeptidase [Paenarthrobacter histidinolovorans]